MAHVYRAVWVDNSISLFDVVSHEYSEWLKHRPGGIDITQNCVNTVGPRTATWTEIETSSGQVMELHLRESVEDDANAWITVLTAFVYDGDNVILADLYTESDEVWNGIIFAPKVVRGILLAGGVPLIGSDVVSIQPREIDDQNSLNELVDGLNDPDRILPYLVIRGGRGSDFNQSMQRAVRASETLAGIAQVFVVDESSSTFLNPLLGEELWIDERSARLLMPGVTEDVLNPALSFLVPFDDLDDDMKTLGRLVLQHISRTSHWPELPDEWIERKREVEAARIQLLHSQGAIEAIDWSIPADATSTEAEVRRLRARVDQLQNEAQTAAIAAQEISEQYQTLLNKTAVQLTNGEHHPMALGSGTIKRVIDDVRRMSKYVVIPESAERSIEDLESNMSATVWAKDMARLFVAMERYGTEVSANRFHGNLFMWCTESGLYPDAKISMQESHSTKVGARTHDARVFAVSTDLDHSGMKLMIAHAKIQLRGRGTIPRVFFFDDMKGPTKKIHIGFIGRHDFVPTSSY